jgi:hypothetical protein
VRLPSPTRRGRPAQAPYRYHLAEDGTRSLELQRVPLSSFSALGQRDRNRGGWLIRKEGRAIGTIVRATRNSVSMSLKVGICQLCRSHAELRESNFMPAAANKLVQRSGGEQPVVIKATVTIQKHEQVKDHLLCANCEQRFSENGERWVMEHCCRHNEGFKLKDLIEASKPAIENGLKVYSVVNIPQIDIDKLAYFSASIMWRASAHDWKSGSVKVRTPKLG